MKTNYAVILLLLGLSAAGAAALPGFPRIFQSEPELVLDRTMRAKVIDALVAKLNERYVFPDKARQIDAVLHQRLQEGKYDGIMSAYRLARQLTADMRALAGDKHMVLRYHPKLSAAGEADGPPPETLAQWEQRTGFLTRMAARNTANRSVKMVARVNPNIGYLKITGFPDAYLMTDRYAEAMGELADTDGLIVDLRHNGGGDPQAVALLISYFVDRRTRLNDIWDRASGKTVQYWTHDTLAGPRYGGSRPVLILAGPDTASAGEDFAYTMQALKRATVIGERTWGGAHPAALHHIGAQFFAQVPEQRSISPITGANWEGVGVTPDIDAAPDRVFELAKDLMRRRLDRGAAIAAAGR